MPGEVSVKAEGQASGGQCIDLARTNAIHGSAFHHQHLTSRRGSSRLFFLNSPNIAIYRSHDNAAFTIYDK